MSYIFCLIFGLHNCVLKAFGSHRDTIFFYHEVVSISCQFLSQVFILGKHPDFTDEIIRGPLSDENVVAILAANSFNTLGTDIRAASLIVGYLAVFQQREGVVYSRYPMKAKLAANRR